MTLNGVGVTTGAAEAEQMAGETLTHTLGLTVDLDTSYRFAAVDARAREVVEAGVHRQRADIASAIGTRNSTYLSAAPSSSAARSSGAASADGCCPEVPPLGPAA